MLGIAVGVAGSTYYYKSHAKFEADNDIHSLKHSSVLELDVAQKDRSRIEQK